MYDFDYCIDVAKGTCLQNLDNHYPKLSDAERNIIVKAYVENFTNFLTRDYLETEKIPLDKMLKAQDYAYQCTSEVLRILHPTSFEMTLDQFINIYRNILSSLNVESEFEEYVFKCEKEHVEATFNNRFEYSMAFQSYADYQKLALLLFEKCKSERYSEYVKEANHYSQVMRNGI
ncbi:hypothetical protein HCC36_16135 [Listeria booriae]|uniref:Uncharacterized protein n=1 Tax=Listeria booriae TaxID=1552123 RepID=A0A842GB49_9LIST|nr:hypothetical protein [Listeria booriae]MBC2294753.1 hypothetical protein [Listeria booriae]